MRVPISASRLVLIAAVVFTLVACVDRGDPTDPGSGNTPKTPSGVITVAVRLPVASLEVGRVIAAAATPMNDAGQAVPSAPVAWSSSDTAILSVSSGGQVSARRMGSATVYATSDGVAGSGTLMVTDSLPAKVVVSPATANESVGGHVQLSASVATHTGRALPGHPVLWSSADSHTATVSSTGVVTGAGTGVARIIALASGVSDTATVNVSAAAIASLSVTPGNSWLASGTSSQLTAHAVDASGNALTGRSVGWSTSDESVATVSTSGVVVGFKVGTATIYASAEGKTGSASIRVSAGAVSKVVVTPGSIGLVAGGTQQLSVSLSDAAGNDLSPQTASWSSSNTSVATVSASGVVTGSHPGSSTITATVAGISGSATAAVSAGAIRSITVSPLSISLSTGGTQQLSATLKDGSGNVLSGQAVAWSSSNSSIATVSTSGVVSATHSGSATITAAAGGASGTASVSVSAGAVASVSVAPGSVSLVAGATSQLTASVTDAGGSAITGQTITWSSSNNAVVSVDASGLATGAHVGTATITASTAGKSGTSLFAVTVGATNGISLTPASGSVQAGKTLQLSAALSDVAGNAVTGRTVAWTSSVPAAATTSATGLVTGVAAGNTNITASADGKSASAAISVTAAPVAPPPPPPPPAPPTAPPPPPPTGSIQAVSSDVFVGSIGVATHFNYYDLTPYGTNRSKTVSTLIGSGIRFIRDGLNVDVNSGSNDAYWGTMKQITQAGMKLILVTQPVYLGNQKWVTAPYANQSNLDTAITRVGASGILAWEGPNEVDNNNANWGGWPQFATNAKLYQAAMYAHAHAIAPGVPVLGFTTTSAYGSAPVGDISANMDFANMHPYPGGSIPTAELSNMQNALSVLNGANKAWWATETGYYTAPNATVNVFQPGVSETAQSKYIPRLYLDFYMRGVSHTSSYELIDERADQTNAEMNYGLLHNDGSPKPSFDALTNMISILSDPGGNFSPGALAYSVTGATSTVRQQLFQKRDGRFYLALWNDVKTWDLNSKRDISNAAVPVTVTFSASPRSLKLYTPLASNLGTPLTAGTSVNVSVLDQVVILEIAP